MKKFQIKRSNLPSRFPFIGTLAIIMALDYYQANYFIKGVVYSLLVLIWIAVIYESSSKEDFDLFQIEKEDVRNEKKEIIKSKFQERLEKMAKERGIDLPKNKTT